MGFIVVISTSPQILYGTHKNYHKIFQQIFFFAGTSMVIFRRSIHKLGPARNYHNENIDNEFFVYLLGLCGGRKAMECRHNESEDNSDLPQHAWQYRHHACTEDVLRESRLGLRHGG